jgi:hypothetical protein
MTDEQAFPHWRTADGKSYYEIPQWKSEPIQSYSPGMTLRDYFAGQALAGITTFETSPAEVSEHCYAIADAMLRERENG